MSQLRSRGQASPRRSLLDCFLRAWSLDEGEHGTSAAIMSRGELTSASSVTSCTANAGSLLLDASKSEGVSHGFSMRESASPAPAMTATTMKIEKRCIEVLVWKERRKDAMIGKIVNSKDLVLQNCSFSLQTMCSDLFWLET